MSFTVLFVVFTLVALVAVFALVYKLKGWKAALLATAATFILAAISFIALIYAITVAM